MLDKVDFKKKKLSKSEYKEERDRLVTRLVVLQEQATHDGIGVVVLFEGWSGAGKGSRISDILYNLDARHTNVHVTEDLDLEEANELNLANRNVTDYYPPMQQFWKALGMRGELTFFDRGWYTTVGQHLVYDPPFSAVEKFLNQEAAAEATKEKEKMFFDGIEHFERQLVNDGYVLKKFFLHITEDTMRERLRKLASDSNTAWRVDEEDLRELDNYKKIYRTFDRMLKISNYDFAPWIVLNAQDRNMVNLTVLRELVAAYEDALNKGKDEAAAAAAAKAQANSASQGEAKVWVDERERTPEEQAAVIAENEKEAARQAKAAPKKSRFKIQKNYPLLDDIRYDLTLKDDSQYKKILKREQKRLFELETMMYRKRIPMILMYEGTDAAGKGGNIKRIAQALDARSYNIFTSPAPTKPELMHPFLWRYWTRLPKAGHVGIYDRSWYGRVLVERVEGFASDEEWGRAYDEINEFESDLIDWGAILLKFWVNISDEEQMARFEAREQNPDKQWKITAEDWRNRDKAPQYREAVQDMFRLTSTDKAPWIVLESDNKHYARIKALKIINDTLERRLLQEG
ncbi:MAG: polyphosphate--AMP phosphotransferase [Coriobacteriia bacterium]|nr:polyphosphate--AMP phosphotransferase [Coriobacteriia bacterium]